VSATTVQLLQAAAEIVGGNGALAARLGIGEALLGRFMTGGRELPDALLLKAVDIILADRQTRSPARGKPDGQAGRPAGLSPAPEIPENGAGGNSATAESGGGG
jgi:hypothetical protein